MMNRRSKGLRYLPAEWETDAVVLLSWPHAGTDWCYMLEEVTLCYVRLAEAIAGYHHLLVVAPDIKVPMRYLSHIDQSKIKYYQVDTNDTWARDFGPITVFENGCPVLCDFKFNGWGLKFAACYDNMVTSRLVSSGIFGAAMENHLGFVLEGGSIESDGVGTIMTTSECLLSPNRNGNLLRQQIEQYIKHVIGADRVLWIEHGYLAGDDTDSHVDTLARFASKDAILYVRCEDPDDEHYLSLKDMEDDLRSFVTADGHPYNLISLPMPDPVYDEEGNRLPATYANFLVTSAAVFLPVYNQPDNDRKAVEIVRIAFPGKAVETVDCRPLIKQHGSLHCVTMQLPIEIFSK